MLAVLQHWADTQPNRIAIQCGDGTMSYGALWLKINQQYDALRSLHPSVMGIALADGPEWIIAHFACLKGAIPQVPLPEFFTPAQRTHALRDAGANRVLTEHGIEFLPHPHVSLPVGTALITYTSGSTGTPKGVCLSAEGMKQVAVSLVEVLGTEASQRHLSVLPLAVLLEQIGGLYSTLLSGGTYVFAGVQKDPFILVQALAAEKATSCILVPELLKVLVSGVEKNQPDLSHLRFAAVGGSRVAPVLMEEAACLGLPVYEGYGLTESASVVAVNTPRHHRVETVGKLLPHIRAFIAPDGEIILHRPAILGYAGGQAWEGSYPTGDIGALDEQGFLTIHGRKKNLLITAYGRNVSPEWPESLLLAQPEIAQALVYGDGDAMLSALLVPSTEGTDMVAALQRVNSCLPDYARIGTWKQVPAFTQANGTLTGNGRLRRDAILQSIQQKEVAHGFL